MEETKKAKKKIQVFPIVNAIIMILLVIITLYPVLNTLAISLNDGTDALRGGIYLWPRKFTWKNYITVLQKDNLLTGAYITVSRTILEQYWLWYRMQFLHLLLVENVFCLKEDFLYSGSLQCM